MTWGGGRGVVSLLKCSFDKQRFLQSRHYANNGAGIGAYEQITTVYANKEPVNNANHGGDTMMRFLSWRALRPYNPGETGDAFRLTGNDDRF